MSGIAHYLMGVLVGSKQSLFRRIVGMVCMVWYVGMIEMYQ